MQVWIVNLERRSDRRQKMTEECAKFGIQPNFFAAADGTKLRVTDEIAHLFAVNDFGSNAGAIGCALSHMALWRCVPSEGMIILEDDVSIVSWDPSSWPVSDLLFLGFTTWKPEMTYEPFNRKNFVGGTFGYAISQKGAQILLNWIEHNGCTNGIDYIMGQKIPELEIKSLAPHIVQSPWFISSNAGDTDIQGCSTRLDLFANWEFIDGYDHINDDFGRAECPLRQASNNCEIVAFNKLGYLKNSKKLKLEVRPQAGGIWVKRPIRIQVECNWCSSEQLRLELNKMAWPIGQMRQFQFISSNIQVDYWLIINSTTVDFDHNRAIYLRLEPWSTDSGAKTWGKWADPQNFMRVLDPMFGFWQLGSDFYRLEIPEKKNRISIILSEKYHDPGHKFRVDFIRFIEFKNDPEVQIDVFGRQNYHNLLSYRGPVVEPKENYIKPWAFYFACENTREKNYISEKFWEPILCETMPLYWGCLNIKEIVPPGACLLSDDFEKNFSIIKKQIQNGRNVEWIKWMQKWILNDHNIFCKILI